MSSGRSDRSPNGERMQQSPDSGPSRASRPEAARASQIIAIANQKGGVGKTTTAINLGTALAAVDKRVLIFDLDPQGNASTGLGVGPRGRLSGSYDVLIDGVEIGAVAHPTAVPGLLIVPSTIDLSGAELQLVGVDRREFRLSAALRPVAADYDYILIDCPPALGLLTLNAMTAATHVLVPLQCEFLALEGLRQLVRTVDQVKKSFNPELQIQGILLTMFDGRNRLSALVAEDVRSFFGTKVYDTVIPRNIRVSEAPSHGKPVLLYDHRCSGALAYMRLASEILRREREVAA